MLSKSICNRQISNALRGRKFALMAMDEEYPYKEPAAATPKQPVIASQSAKNGIRIVAREKDTGVATLRFAVLGGSSTETATQRGSAHYLGATGFAGTANSSGLRLVKELEGLGATFASVADREKIVFDVAVMQNHVGDAVQSMLEVLATAPVHNHVLDELKPEVQQNQYNNMWNCSETTLNELIHEAAFGELTPYGSSLFADRLEKLSVEDILQYRAKHFVRENIVIAADGVSANHVADLVEKYGSSVATGTALTPPQAKYHGGEVKVRCHETDATHFALAFSTPSGQNGQVYEVLHAALCAQLEKKKIQASTFSNKYVAGGLLGITSQGNATDAEKIIKAIVEELKGIASNGAIAESARNMAALCKFSKLDSRSGASSLLCSYLNGVADVNASCDTRKVTAQQVSDAAKALLKSNPSWAVYGNIAGSPSLSTVSKWLA